MKSARQQLTPIGAIGDDWELVELSQVAEPPQYGLTASTAQKGNTQFLRITDIEGKNVNWSSVPYCDCPAGNLRKYLLRPGDILLARIGATTGKSTLVVDPPNAVFASYLIRVRVKADLDQEFLSHFFQSQAYWQQIDGSKHTNLKKGVNGSLLKALLLPKPPLEEQRGIARLLSAVQRAIERQERLIALTAELKKAVMHKLFTEGTRGEPQKQTEIGPVPRSWTIERFNLRFEAKLGKMLSQKARSGKHARCYLRNKNVQWGRIDLDDLLEMDFDEKERMRFELRKGDLLVCEGGEPGRAAIWKGAPFECYYQKALHRVRPRDGTATNDYLLCWLAYAIGTRDLYGIAGASSTIAHLPVAQLNALPVPFPSRGEQDAIAEAVAAVSRSEGARQAIHKSLGCLFRTLLHQLMTAEIRVSDLDLSQLDPEFALQEPNGQPKLPARPKRKPAHSRC